MKTPQWTLRLDRSHSRRYYPYHRVRSHTAHPNWIEVDDLGLSVGKADIAQRHNRFVLIRQKPLGTYHRLKQAQVLCIVTGKGIFAHHSDEKKCCRK